MKIQCPSCSREVEVGDDRVFPYHDSAPPTRMVCGMSRRDATEYIQSIERGEKTQNAETSTKPTRKTLPEFETHELIDEITNRLNLKRAPLDIDSVRAELVAVYAAIHEEQQIDEDRAEHGCGDTSCLVKRPVGMSTNSGCRCGRRALRAAILRLHKELNTKK